MMSEDVETFYQLLSLDENREDHSDEDARLEILTTLSPKQWHEAETHTDWFTEHIDLGAGCRTEPLTALYYIPDSNCSSDDVSTPMGYPNTSTDSTEAMQCSEVNMYHDYHGSYEDHLLGNESRGGVMYPDAPHFSPTSFLADHPFDTDVVLSVDEVHQFLQDLSSSDSRSSQINPLNDPVSYDCFDYQQTWMSPDVSDITDTWSATQTITNSGEENKNVRKKEHSKKCYCPVPGCNTGFGRIDELKRHQRKHSGEKPFTCDVCKMAFYRKDNLRTHQRKHTGERPYKCSHCGRQFARSDEVKRHENTHLRATSKRSRKPKVMELIEPAENLHSNSVKVLRKSISRAPGSNV